MLPPNQRAVDDVDDDDDDDDDVDSPPGSRAPAQGLFASRSPPFPALVAGGDPYSTLPLG